MIHSPLLLLPLTILLVALVQESKQMLARLGDLEQQPFYRQPKLMSSKPLKMRSPISSAPGANIAYDSGAIRSFYKRKRGGGKGPQMDPMAFIERPYLEQDTGNDCSSYPNSTDQHPHIFSCPTGKELLAVHDAAVTNSTGDDHYPVDFRKTVRIFLDVTSYANRRSDYGMCSENPSCPIVPGRQVLEVNIDPSGLFKRLFRMVHDDQSVYQLVLRVRHNAKPYEKLLCATIQTKINL